MTILYKKNRNSFKFQSLNKPKRFNLKKHVISSKLFYFPKRHMRVSKNDKNYAYLLNLP